MSEKSKDYNAGYAVAKGIGQIRFTPGTQNYNALVTLPYAVFQDYTPDAKRMFDRGEVVRVDKCKYLLTGDGRIDPSDPPRIDGNQVKPYLCKLFRDSGKYDWVKEEYCLRGFERYYIEPGRPDREGWYRVKSDRVDSSTPPPDNYLDWEKVV